MQEAFCVTGLWCHIIRKTEDKVKDLPQRGRIGDIISCTM